MKSLFLCGIIAFLAVSPPAARAALTVGSPAPEFDLEICDIDGLTGGTYSSAVDGAQKVLYLQFCLPTCPSCKLMAKRIENEVAPRYAGNPGVEFILVQGVYGNDSHTGEPYTIDQVRDFIRETGYSHLTVVDREGWCFSDYEIDGSPYLYAADADHAVRYVHKGSASSAEIITMLDGLLGIGPPPAPPSPSCLSIECSTSCGITQCGVSDRLKICVAMPEISYAFDAYGVIRKPDGSYLSMTIGGGLVPGIVPLATGVPSHPVPAQYTLLDTDVPPGTPPGDYEVIVALTEPGTLASLCEDRTVITVE